jgi:hypothetical protein
LEHHQILQRPEASLEVEELLVLLLHQVVFSEAVQVRQQDLNQLVVFLEELLLHQQTQ